MPTIRQGIYSLLSAVEIDTKEEGRTHVTPWLSQRMIIDAVAKGLSEGVHEFVVLKSRQMACCLEPTMRVLTANLRWVPIGLLQVGDDLIAFDEFATGGKGSARRMRTATVQAVVKMRAPAFRINFEDGRFVVCTANHPWLSRKVEVDWLWRTLTRTRRGGRNGGNKLTIGTKIRTICRPWGEGSYEDGWFAGMLDGEGSISNNNMPGCRLLITQKKGLVLDRAMRYAVEKGYHFGIDNDEIKRDSKFGTDPCPRIVFSRMDEIFQILGQSRPSRESFQRKFWEDRELPNAPFATIASIEPLGEQDVIDLQTSTGTYIAEGLASHNTTVCSVIELFWCLANPGIQGAIIADRGDNLERLRRIFASLLETLPAEWRGPDHRILVNNRSGMAFANRSVIDLLAAANNPDLGASRAINLGHFTECALWRSIAGVESLKASLARQNPNRLYIWESIANGLGNWFHGHWQQAKTDRHMKAIFIGFWANPTYSLAKTDPDFSVYMPKDRQGRYSFTEDELKDASYVKQNYGYTIKPEQVAWWRREAEFKDEVYMWRHFPWHERQAFISSGQGFFPAKITLEIAESLAVGAPYKGYKYIFKEEGFLSSRIEQVTDTGAKDEVMLKVWEPPQPNGIYAIGIDPSGGGGGDANDHAIEVFRGYSDRIVQVAEFQTNRPYTYQIAWVLAHLCGAYRNHIANLEITGIGAAVLPEIRNLRQLAERGILQGDPALGHIFDMIGSVRWFLYQRPDTYGGAGNVHSWKTNADNKAMIFSELRDSLGKQGQHNICIEIRSSPLINQMQAIVEDNGWLGAGPDTGEHDDLVMAAVLAHHTWTKWQRPGLVAANVTWDSVNGPRPPQNMDMVMSWINSEHWRKVHARRAERRERF